MSKKICWVIASPLAINFFLRDHIAMLARDYELTVITNTRDPEFLADLGVPLMLISMPIARNVHLWSDFKVLIALALLFHRERFEVVHSLSPKTGLLAMVSAWLMRVPVRVHTFQGEVWVTRTGVWRAFLKFLDKVAASCATHLTVVGFSERQFLIEHGVASADKLQVLGQGSICGVNTQRFKPDPQARRDIRAALGIDQSDIVFLFVGRLNRDKGLLELANAFLRVNCVYPNTRLMFVGPEEANLQAAIELVCEAVHARLHFVDYTPNPEKYMASCDVLCLPSYREGFSMALLEAAATGVPTIGSRIYGNIDAIVDEHSGLLFNPRDVEDLVRQMLRLIKEPDLRARLGSFGMQRVKENFSKDYVLSEMSKLYGRFFEKNF